MRAIFLVLLLGALFSVLDPGSTRGQDDLTPDIGMKVGDYFPDFRLPTLDGEIVSLSSFRGRKILLIQFASW